MRGVHMKSMLREVRSGWATQALYDALARVPARYINESCVTPYLTLRALWYAQPSQVRVVILGADPYPSRLRASGLAFGTSSAESQVGRAPLTSSLRNIVAEVARSTGQVVDDLSLVSWARQGVLLLNTSLSVAEGRPGSHAGAWDEVVQLVLKLVAEQSDKATWLLWGKQAHATWWQLDPLPVHYTAYARHPSGNATRGVAVPFKGCDHFKLAGERHNVRWGV